MPCSFQLLTMLAGFVRLITLAAASRMSWASAGLSVVLSSFQPKGRLALPELRPLSAALRFPLVMRREMFRDSMLRWLTSLRAMAMPASVVRSRKPVMATTRTP